VGGLASESGGGAVSFDADDDVTEVVLGLCVGGQTFFPTSDQTIGGDPRGFSTRDGGVIDIDFIGENGAETGPVASVCGFGELGDEAFDAGPRRHQGNH
jgi:hypothetical protein